MSTLRPSITRKQEEAIALSKLIAGHRTLMIIDAERVRTTLMNEMRDMLRGRVTFRYTKPSILRRAIESGGDQQMKELAEKYARGAIVLAVSDEDAFKLSRELANKAIHLPAKAGDTATDEIIVEPGNTGLPPGPVISELNDAGIPTRIETGSVWVTRRTSIAKPGEKITTRVASALSKLGLKPIRSRLRPICAWYDGSLLNEGVLLTTREQVISQVIAARNAEIALSIASDIFTKESLPAILRRAAAEARALVASSSFITPESAEVLLAEAARRASALQSSLANKGA